MVAGEEDTAAAGDDDKGGEKQQQQQQLSISLETKMPPDVVAAVLATKSSSAEGVADDEIRKIEKVESREIETKEGTEEIAKEKEEEQRNAVDESLTISMLADEDRESEKSPREDDDDDTKAAKAEEEEEKSRPTFATEVYEDDDRARIDEWVATVKRQNYQCTSSIVHYDETMPSLDDLLAAMEGWSQEFLEEALTTNNTTTSSTSSSGTTIDPDLDLTFEEYTEVVCALLGVPIYKGRDGKTSNRNLIQSLHLATSLYIEVDEEAQQQQQQQHSAEQDNDIF